VRATQAGKASLLKAGEPCLNTFTAERVRIDNAEKREGHFSFSQYLYFFRADKRLNHQANVLCARELKHARRWAASCPYWLNQVSLINYSYSLTGYRRGRCSGIRNTAIDEKVQGLARPSPTPRSCIRTRAWRRAPDHCSRLMI
jgi:hypothetical protein